MQFDEKAWADHEVLSDTQQRELIKRFQEKDAPFANRDSLFTFGHQPYEFDSNWTSDFESHIIRTR